MLKTFQPKAYRWNPRSLTWLSHWASLSQTAQRTRILPYMSEWTAAFPESTSCLKQVVFLVPLTELSLSRLMPNAASSKSPFWLGLILILPQQQIPSSIILCMLMSWDIALVGTQHGTWLVQTYKNVKATGYLSGPRANAELALVFQPGPIKKHPDEMVWRKGFSVCLLSREKKWRKDEEPILQKTGG